MGLYVRKRRLSCQRNGCYETSEEPSGVLIVTLMHEVRWEQTPTLSVRCQVGITGHSCLVDIKWLDSIENRLE